MDDKILCSTTDNIEALDLSVRVRNALRRSNVFDVGELIVLDDHQLFAVRNLGEKGVAEIKERLSRVALLDALPSVEESKIVGESSWQPQILIDLGPPTIPRHEVVKWLQKMLALQIDSKLLYPSLKIGGDSLDALATDSVHSEELYEHLLRILVSPITVSQELEQLFSSVPPREIDILMRRFGFKSETLEAVASEVGVSRERVRQLQHQAIDRVKFSAASLNFLRIRTAIAFADDPGLSFDDWSQSLHRTGLVGIWTLAKLARYDPIEQLTVVCSLLKHKDKILTVPESLEHMIALHGEGMSTVPARTLILFGKLSKKMDRFVKRHLGYSGAVSLEWLVSHDSFDLNKSDLRLVLETKGYEAIDDNWYWSDEYMPGSLEKDSVLHRSLQKMFQYCGPLEIHDVFFGIEHTLSKTEFPKPPVNILTEILSKYGYDCEEGLWYWDGTIDEELNGGEEIILQTIRHNDGVVHHSQLGVAFLDSSLSFPLLHATLSRSPLFDNFERGLYKLRGSAPSPTSVIEARDSGIETPVELEHHFDMEGNIAVLANLGTLALGNGSIASERLPNLVGVWKCDGSGIDAGAIDVTDNEIRGLRRALRLLGCRVGDRIQLIFDTDTRYVSVSKVKVSE